ncbi:MAG: type I methionyl aminopeptidase [Oscillospiraceae bacterium]|jgi:methionyl aminopeptidase|nr:type I methionyl aminopeptidase [Oscillospiraceae bacterium]
MISIKNDAQIEKMRAAGRLLHSVLEELRRYVKPGATTSFLNGIAHRMITDAGAKPSFLGYEGFPASLCTSVNDVVVHGIPNDEPLVEGDILGLDCGLVLDGWQADSAYTMGVGVISAEHKRLIDVTEECFWKGVSQMKPGRRLSDIGASVQAWAESNGYQPIRALCGHGIGREMHEDPEVPNYGKPGRGPRLAAGMTLAIEPMIAMGGYEVDTEGWRVATRDHSWVSHYEHTVLITRGEPEILTLPDAARAAEAGR